MSHSTYDLVIIHCIAAVYARKVLANSRHMKRFSQKNRWMFTPFI
ncbi:hypothetical protein COPCOM_01483 [Coprococcus comes ATCC 27758]|uniref:Uncharacterized protein n=1 Tax=Coprococcus comes ATCC 27758 TaxID=470146 RepID=C0B8K9_9FIRM|nr:hypothetical protein COPCOM_01483 [Coprococcus comes ATCC 27758]